MAPQPSGSVTFLFTDVEGSTRLLRTLGEERYGSALQEHCDLLRAAFERHDGYEVNYEGDAFFIAFASPSEGVAAAQEAQQALSAHEWPGKTALRVRMGIHTGRPRLAPPKYVGLDIHRAARIAAAGHGGQVLVSVTTAEALPPDTFDLRDLGEHRFKDLSAPEHVYQLGDGDFPPLNALYRTNLPIPPTAFVGRVRELSEVVELLGDEEIRLLTLTGPGGTGKTRLAAQAAGEAAIARYPDGVWWVDLTSLREPSLVLPALARTIGVKDDADAALAATITAWIARKNALYVLDNAEHLLPGFAQVLSPMVRDTERARFLVTSRERLRIAGEVVHAVPALASDDGVELFLARAAAAGVEVARSPGLDELCRELDHLPLALELAAARAPVLAPEEMLDRLSQRLDLLKGGRDADPRQQTLRATITWSYDLLSEQERTSFPRLAVFVGGCTLEAAEQVCGIELDVLASLVDKNLVRRSDGRFTMLETIRVFARERLEGGDDAADVLRFHAEWYAGLADRAAEYLYGPEQGPWLDVLEREHDNLRAALDWGFEFGQPAFALGLSATLVPFWYRHGHITEGRRWLERAVAVSPNQPPALRARVLQGAGVFAGAQDDWRRAGALAEEGLALYRELGDRRGTAILLRDLGSASVRRGDYPATKSFYEESLSICRDLDDPRLLSTVISNLGDLAFRQGDFEHAAENIQESLALQRELGATFGVAISLIMLGFIMVSQERDEDARVALVEGMLLAHELGSTDNLAYAFEGMAAVAAARLDWDLAAPLLGRAEAMLEASATELEAAERAVHEQTLSALRAARSETEIREGVAAGRELSDDAAVTLALSMGTAEQV